MNRGQAKESVPLADKTPEGEREFFDKASAEPGTAIKRTVRKRPEPFLLVPNEESYLTCPQLGPLRVIVAHLRQPALHADELGPVRIPVLFEPVRVHQPQRRIVRIFEYRLKQGVAVVHGSLPSWLLH